MRAWMLVTGPDYPRDPEWALVLARKAVALAPNEPMYLNTLGIILYRTARYADAVAIALEKSLAAGKVASQTRFRPHLPGDGPVSSSASVARRELTCRTPWNAAGGHSQLALASWTEELGNAFEAETRAVLGMSASSSPLGSSAQAP